MNIYKATIRNGPQITKRVAVQAYDEEDARMLIERLLMNSMETVLDDNIRDITDQLGEKERFREFVERQNDIDYLLCTGGKWPSIVESGWVRDRRPLKKSDMREQ